MQDTEHQHARGAKAAQECQTCHARASEAGHLFPGGHDAAVVARAVTVTSCRDGDALDVTLTNAGAGHNVPTGDLHRHLVLRAWRPSAPERLAEASSAAASRPGGRRQARRRRHDHPGRRDAPRALPRRRARRHAPRAHPPRASPRLHDRRVPLPRPRARRPHLSSRCSRTNARGRRRPAARTRGSDSTVSRLSRSAGPGTSSR